MALAKLGKQWVGKRREFSGIFVETCYDVYADMSNANVTPYLVINNFCIYAQQQAALISCLPFSVTVTINGSSYSFQTVSYTSANGTSPNGNTMPYFVRLTPGTNIPITQSGEFEISVSIQPQTGTAISFTEDAHKPIASAWTVPSLMYTGRAYTFTASSQIPGGTDYKTTIAGSWFPQNYYYYTREVSFSGYYDAFTDISEAPQAFTAFKVAIRNLDNLPELDILMANANISMQTYYLSEDFTDGILIGAFLFAVPTKPREAIDSDLTAELSSSDISISAEPASGVINGKYVNGQVTLTFTVNARSKYGAKTQALIDGVNRRYAGNTYTETITGYDLVGQTSATVTERFRIYDMWGYSAYASKSFTVLYYWTPIISKSAVHRCKKLDADDGSTTCFVYNGEVYKYDDVGSYCRIDWGVNCASLDNGNTVALTITYGSTSMPITPSSVVSDGFIVVPANTETTLNVILRLTDRYYPAGVSVAMRLSTAGVLMDFLAGGKGIGIGKVAEDRNTLDINPDWIMKFYAATIGNYQNNTAQDLIAWMHDIDDRLTELEDSVANN